LVDDRIPRPTQVELTLHIGMSKTGTTSIQRFLATNRARLVEGGVLYPKSPGTPRHLRLGMAMKTDEQLARTPAWYGLKVADPDVMRRRFGRRLRREIAESGVDRVLMSDEILYATYDDAIARLRRFTDDVSRRLRVVVYLRRQDDHLLSNYQQLVKAGSTMKLADYAAGDRSRSYDYSRRLAFWEQVVAPDELVVRAFDRSFFRGGSLLEDFLDACDVDIPLDELEGTRDQNASLDAECVEFLRLYNLHQQRSRGVGPAQVRNRAVRQRLRQLPQGPTLALPTTTLDDFMEQWSASNRAVARHHLGRDDLFGASRSQKWATSVQHLDPTRLDELMVAVDLPTEDRPALRRLAEQGTSSRA
jgi:hypothetical protein